LSTSKEHFFLSASSKPAVPPQVGEAAIFILRAVPGLVRRTFHRTGNQLPYVLVITRKCKILADGAGKVQKRHIGNRHAELSGIKETVLTSRVDFKKKHSTSWVQNKTKKRKIYLKRRKAANKNGGLGR